MCTCETAAAFHAAPHTYGIHLDRSGQLHGSCHDPHILQTRQCRRMLVSLLFPELACTCTFLRVLHSFLPKDTNMNKSNKESLYQVMCDFKGAKIEISHIQILSRVQHIEGHCDISQHP